VLGDTIVEALPTDHRLLSGFPASDQLEHMAEGSPSFGDLMCTLLEVGCPLKKDVVTSKVRPSHLLATAMVMQRPIASGDVVGESVLKSQLRAQVPWNEQP